MGKHSGGRGEATRTMSTPNPAPGPRPPVRTLLPLALALAATLIAWGTLVYAAIDFGGQARSGQAIAWVFLALSTIGAAACLFVTLLLGARLLSLLQGREPVPARIQGGRRAAR